MQSKSVGVERQIRHVDVAAAEVQAPVVTDKKTGVTDADQLLAPRQGAAAAILLPNAPRGDAGDRDAVFQGAIPAYRRAVAEALLEQAPVKLGLDTLFETAKRRPIAFPGGLQLSKTKTGVRVSGEDGVLKIDKNRHTFECTLKRPGEEARSLRLDGNMFAGLLGEAELAAIDPALAARLKKDTISLGMGEIAPDLLVLHRVLSTIDAVLTGGRDAARLDAAHRESEAAIAGAIGTYLARPDFAAQLRRIAAATQRGHDDYNDNDIGTKVAGDRLHISDSFCNVDLSVSLASLNRGGVELTIGERGKKATRVHAGADGAMTPGAPLELIQHITLSISAVVKEIERKNYD